MRLNMEYVKKEYIEIAKILGIETLGKTDEQVVLEGIERLEEIEKNIEAPVKLSDYMTKEEFDMEMVLDNIQTSMGHIKTTAGLYPGIVPGAFRNGLVRR